MFGSTGSLELKLRLEANRHAWWAQNMRDRSLAALISHAISGEQLPPPPVPPGREPAEPQEPPRTQSRLWVPPGART